MNSFGVAALTVASVVGVAMPARASLLTAAYVFATEYCSGLRYGLDTDTAVLEANKSVLVIFPEEFVHPKYTEISVARAIEMCPQLVIEAQRQKRQQNMTRPPARVIFGEPATNTNLYAPYNPSEGLRNQ